MSAECFLRSRVLSSSLPPARLTATSPLGTDGQQRHPEITGPSSPPTSRTTTTTVVRVRDQYRACLTVNDGSTRSRRGDSAHEEWVRLKPNLPKSGWRGDCWADHRRFVKGIPFRLRTGVPWWDLPARFGPWRTMYERYRRWSADGAWDRGLAAVLTDADAEGPIGRSVVSVDSTSCRARHHAAEVRR